MKEVWKDIPGFEGRYCVSDLGNVYSYHSNRLLRPGRMPQGHMSVSLGARNSRCVHELVLTTFVGPRPEGYDARHLNGIPSDNRLVNLEWNTRGVNIRDKKYHCVGSKLNIHWVRSIKSLLAYGHSVKDVADIMGVAHSTISSIKTGRNHRDVV